jgi:hypothetical protein
MYYESNRRCPVTPNDITLALCHAVRLIGPEVDLVETDVSARFLWAGGAMALLGTQVDDNIIRLLVRWQSDAMLRYLHLQARPVMRNFAAHMLQHGMYDLLQNVQKIHKRIKLPPSCHSHPSFNWAYITKCALGRWWRHAYIVKHLVTNHTIHVMHHAGR